MTNPPCGVLNAFWSREILLFSESDDKRIVGREAPKNTVGTATVFDERTFVPREYPNISSSSSGRRFTRDTNAVTTARR